MKAIKARVILTLVLLVSFFSAFCEGGEVIFDRRWDAASGQHPTDANPRWVRYGSKGGDSLDENALVFDTPSRGPAEREEEAISRSYHIVGKLWDSETNGATIEFRMKVMSVALDASYSTAIGFSTGERSFRFLFDPMGVSSNCKHSVDLDTTVWRTYRIVYEPGGGAELFVDGGSDPIMVAEGVAALGRPSLYFGSVFSYTAGVSHWEYVHYTNRLAIKPSGDAGSPEQER